ncbi:multiple sugar transport system permease protein [Fervidobacterium changbaicum]|uniref:Carbohydrate ABC transporter permease n=1 Tax=Fervidobacterium changbaicum TaxID=310769 RepID=A0ABX5QT08_9BACT|nr:carbohydrate ABC transporter permease [Fervidobacterium changbaicum]QAV33240.1 carbohydrate ABC transporter permease [Fervidobacterium changbaicum]SDH05735.1 multiple sugar transport system permease protein [Fervidobacterium changbaicum]
MRRVDTKNTFSKLLSLVIDVAIWFFLIGFAVFVLIPVVFMFTASLMPARDIMSIPYPWIPRTLHIQNFWQAIKGNDGKFLFPRSILNSLIVASLTTLGTVLLSALTAFGLAKYKFRARNVIFLIILSTMMIPFEAIMIPLYLLIVNIGWQDTYTGLIIPLIASAFGIFIMRQFFITFPDELIDSARIDGANEFMIFWKIALPNSKPAIAALSVLTFRAQWDNLIWPLLVVQSPEKKTIPLYISQFASEKYTNEGALMAAAVIASIPMIIIFLSFTKYFITGAELFTGRK